MTTVWPSPPQFSLRFPSVPPLPEVDSCGRTSRTNTFIVSHSFFLRSHAVFSPPGGVQGQFFSDSHWGFWGVWWINGDGEQGPASERGLTLERNEFPKQLENVKRLFSVKSWQREAASHLRDFQTLRQLSRFKGTQTNQQQSPLFFYKPETLTTSRNNQHLSIITHRLLTETESSLRLRSVFLKLLRQVFTTISQR